MHQKVWGKDESQTNVMQQRWIDKLYVKTVCSSRHGAKLTRGVADEPHGQISPGVGKT